MSFFSSISLEREPFSTSPDPHFFYHSLEHQHALHRLEIAIRLRRGLSVVLGEVGSGKTTLSRALFQSFNGESEYLFFLILDPSFTSEKEFLAYLLKVFHLKVPVEDVAEYRVAIEQFLLYQAMEEKKTVVLVIDEGQKLSTAQLEVLRVLLNYETNEYKLLQLVILGQMELLATMEKMPNFIDRISTKLILNPLDEYETGCLIDYRLRRAGFLGGRELFTPLAIRKVFRHSKGRPRKINMICHRALERLIAQELDVITEELMEHVIQEDLVWHEK